MPIAFLAIWAFDGNFSGANPSPTANVAAMLIGHRNSCLFSNHDILISLLLVVVKNYFHFLLARLVDPRPPLDIGLLPSHAVKLK